MDATLDQIHNNSWKILTQLYEALLVYVDKVRDMRNIDLIIADPFRIPDLGRCYDSSVADEVAAFLELDHLFERLEEALDNRFAKEAEHLFKKVARECIGLRISVEDRFREYVEETLDISMGDSFREYLEETLAIVSVSEPSIIFASETPPIYVPELIVTAQQFLIDKIRRNPDAIFGISPRAFEELIAEIFYNNGFHVELTRATRDGGRDIIAIHQILGVRLKYLIECKRYAPHHKVSLAIVQRLYGVKIAETANKAILATTSSFTRDARVFANQHLWDLDLRGYEEIMQWVRDYGAT